jgi:hypothetical protein
MDVALVVVPIQCYPNVLFACLIACKFVVFFECVLKMVCMFFANVYDAKIINNQCELYGSCIVLPKSRYQFVLLLSVFVEACFEKFVGQ